MLRKKLLEVSQLKLGRFVFLLFFVFHNKFEKICFLTKPLEKNFLEFFIDKSSFVMKTIASLFACERFEFYKLIF